MKTLEEIIARLEELRSMLGDEEKRGKTTFSEIEEEVRELNKQKAEKEAELRLKEDLEKEKREAAESAELEKRKLGDYTPGTKTDEPEGRSAFATYLETRDIAADGLKLDEGYVIVPKEESKQIIELADDIVRLKELVTVRPVSTGSGTQPVRTTAKAKLSTVEQLAESPKIGVTPFTEVDYKVETKRGYIPYSEEYKQDGINLVPDLKQYIGEVVINTENDDILKELDTVRKKDIKSIDALKTLLNTGFSAGKKGRIKFVTSQTVFDNLDRIKDKNGKYILQESITSATGHKLLGYDILALDDDYFTNNKTMFVGDLKEIVYFDRSDVRVQWTSYLHFGECLGVALRNDVGKVEDTKTKVNIYKATVDIPTEPEVAVVP